MTDQRNRGQGTNTGCRSVHPGWTRCFPLNVVSVMVYLILLGLVVLLVWRLTGYAPWQQTKGEPEKAPPHRPSFVLLGSHGDTVYVFQRETENIVAYKVKGAETERVLGSIPSVERVILAPDSSRVALVSTTSGTLGGLYVLDWLADQVVWVTSPQADFPAGFSLSENSAVSWSPKGDRIAFVAQKHDKEDLFIAWADGSQVQRITYLESHIGSIMWLDTETIAFVSDWEGKDLVYLVDADGGNLRRMR